VLEIKVDQADDYTVCRPAGELDAFTVGHFRESLTELGVGGRLLIDLTGVPFLDSAGLGALIGGVRRAREAGGDVAVFGARPAVARLLHTTGFDRVASVADSERDAREALSTV
jgi:anti-sigma B factor antagonist